MNCLGLVGNTWHFFSFLLKFLNRYPPLKTLLKTSNGTPLQCSCLENPMDGGAWWAAVHGVAKSDVTEQLHFHLSLSCIGEGNGKPRRCSCLEDPRTGEPGGLPSMGSLGIWHDWSDLAMPHQHKMHTNHLENISKIQILIQEVGSGAWDSAFLIESQVMLMLLVPEPYSEKPGPNLHYGMYNFIIKFYNKIKIFIISSRKATCNTVDTVL